MSNQQIEKIKNFFAMKKNKSRLLEMMKNGEYLQFSEVKGFIYAVKIGEANGMDIMLKVAMLNGQLEIMNAFEKMQPVVKAA